MEFVGLVEDDLAMFQNVGIFIRTYLGGPHIYALKFPEVMFFPRKMKVIAVFKIMNSKDLFYMKFIH